MFTLMKDFLADQARQARLYAREAVKKRCGILHASGGAEGSPKSRTPKRARQRASRRLEKLLNARETMHNPAGSKLLRRYAKARLGFRLTYEEAAAYHRDGSVPEREAA